MAITVATSATLTNQKTMPARITPGRSEGANRPACWCGRSVVSDIASPLTVSEIAYWPMLNAIRCSGLPRTRSAITLAPDSATNATAGPAQSIIATANVVDVDSSPSMFPRNTFSGTASPTIEHSVKTKMTGLRNSPYGTGVLSSSHAALRPPSRMTVETYGRMRRSGASLMSLYRLIGAG